MSDRKPQSDNDFFESAIREINKKKSQIQTKHDEQPFDSSEKNQKNAAFKSIFLHDCNDPYPLFGPEDHLWHSKSALVPAQKAQLKKPSFSEKIIDLHGKTKQEAIDALNHLMQQAADQGPYRWIIVHGKGHRSASETPAVLKNMVYQYLKKQPLVLAFSSAQPIDGGTGALYVLLRKKKH